jgi:hypothetical protein
MKILDADSGINKNRLLVLIDKRLEAALANEEQMKQIG